MLDGFHTSSSRIIVRELAIVQRPGDFTGKTRVQLHATQHAKALCIDDDELTPVKGQLTITFRSRKSNTP